MRNFLDSSPLNYDYIYFMVTSNYDYDVILKVILGLSGSYRTCNMNNYNEIFIGT